MARQKPRYINSGNKFINLRKPVGASPERFGIPLLNNRGRESYLLYRIRIMGWIVALFLIIGKINCRKDKKQ